MALLVFDSRVCLIAIHDGYPEKPFPTHLGEVKISPSITVNNVAISIGAIVNVGIHKSVLFVGFLMVRTLPTWVREER